MKLPSPAQEDPRGSQDEPERPPRERPCNLEPSTRKGPPKQPAGLRRPSRDAQGPQRGPQISPRPP
eukprot:450878-Pyramimonas_sp.AAC.1